MSDDDDIDVGFSPSAPSPARTLSYAGRAKRPPGLQPFEVSSAASVARFWAFVLNVVGGLILLGSLITGIGHAKSAGAVYTIIDGLGRRDASEFEWIIFLSWLFGGLVSSVFFFGFAALLRLQAASAQDTAAKLSR